jgi:peptidoglycan/LPS O-acetylase OafA/YrhL
MAQRDLYIDRLRTAMTAIVVVFHAAITYGAVGGWFYHEIQPSRSPASLLMTFFVTTNQAYFMGFFFLLAGYYTPPSLERKGYARFLGDRFLRLGIPLLAFGLFIGPLTAAMVNVAKGGGFWSTFVWLWNHKEFINGPLWFAQALLIFSVVYCAWRRWVGAPLAQSERTPRPIPGFLWWLVSAVGVGAVSVAIRQSVPVGQNVFGLQLAYFPGYIFLFALGIAAWRYDWLRQLHWQQARPWIFGLILTWPCMPIAIAVATAHGPANFSGGHSWPALVYAFWDPFVAWGIMAAWLLVFRGFLNQPSLVWLWLGRRAYAVYIIHPAVLVGVSLLLRHWPAPALEKWAVVGSLACLACWLVADPLVRLPGVRRVI